MIPQDKPLQIRTLSRKELKTLAGHIGAYATATFRVIDDPLRYDKLVIATISPAEGQSFQPFELTDYFLECIGDVIQDARIINKLLDTARQKLIQDSIIQPHHIYYTLTRP